MGGSRGKFRVTPDGIKGTIKRGNMKGDLPLSFPGGGGARNSNRRLAGRSRTKAEEGGKGAS